MYNNMRKTTIGSLLICNSNMFIPTVLTEVLSHSDKHYLVISDTDNIRKFFEFLALPNVIYKHYGFNPKQDGRLGFIRHRNELLNYVSQYEIGRVVFFHAEYGAMANWLIERLSKTIPIQYCKLYDAIPVPTVPFSLRKVKMILSERIHWGQKMDILSGVTTIFPSLPESFFRKVKAEVIKMPIDNDLISSILLGKLKAFNIKGKYVLLTGTAVHNGWYTEDIYTLFINDLIDVLGLERVVSKCHPRYQELYGKERELSQIPSFVPGNVLLESFDYYIGLESTLLVEAAKAGKVAISYIDLLRPNEQRCKSLHAFFENRLQGKGVIHFPTSLTELRECVGSHQNLE